MTYDEYKDINYYPDKITVHGYTIDDKMNFIIGIISITDLSLYDLMWITDILHSIENKRKHK